MMKFVHAMGAMLLAGGLTLAGQTAPPGFEVASVKASGSAGGGVRGGCRGIDSKSAGENGSSIPLGRCVIADARLSHLIVIAWKLTQIGLIENAPDWVMSGSERFTIEARTEDPASTTEAQLLAMLRNLLIERFQLKFRREERQVPGFSLGIGKDGPKFQISKDDTPAMSFGGRGKPVRGGPVSLVARAQSMAALASLLSQIAQDGQIADGTGLGGLYDFKLSWDEAAGPSLSTALQEQMGLRLNKTQGVPVSWFVFESAQRPGAN